MQRMQGEECCHERTPAQCLRHPVKQPEQQQGIENMEEQIGDVLRSSVHSVKLHVEHVRQPGYRMPVGCIRRRQSPPSALPCQAPGNMEVLRDILRIVQ